MKNGQAVGQFEREFASYVGAKYAIALCNGTATLHTALVALFGQGSLGNQRRIAVPPLTMSATTIAVLHAGAVPVFCDVDPRHWTMDYVPPHGCAAAIVVSLYGLSPKFGAPLNVIDDAAQTLRKHDSGAAFTSYSFQASKLLALGEGGMLVTNDEALATRAREFSSLGYKMRADQPRIDPKVLKSPTFERHHSLGWNYRMNDVSALRGLKMLSYAGQFRRERQDCADLYRDAIAGCDWLTPQHVPEGWMHDHWTFAVATDTTERCLALLDAVEKHGGERPYPAWRLTYQEPAFKHLHPCAGTAKTVAILAKANVSVVGLCPVAESLQPRLVQFQTNDLASAEQNARALRKAIEELS